jgi:hypothetical protein
VRGGSSRARLARPRRARCRPHPRRRRAERVVPWTRTGARGSGTRRGCPAAACLTWPGRSGNRPGLAAARGRTARSAAWPLAWLGLGEWHLRHARSRRAAAVWAWLGRVLAGTRWLDRAWRRCRLRAGRRGLLGSRLRRRSGVRRGCGYVSTSVRGTATAIGCSLPCGCLRGRGLVGERLLEPADDRRLDRR